jgi:plastocyanin
MRLMLLAMCALIFAASPGAASAEILHVTIKNMMFSRIPATAQVGDVIEWSNEDFAAHTATARDHSFDALIAPGKTGRTVLQHPGKVRFFCRFHPNMAGEIDVTPAVTSAAGDRNSPSTASSGDRR